MFANPIQKTLLSTNTIRRASYSFCSFDQSNAPSPQSSPVEGEEDEKEKNP
jgi:hypothetical protein